MRALILDRSHTVLLAETGLPEVPAGERPLATLLAALPFPLPAPAGSRANADGGRDFAFIGERFDAPDGYTWTPLRTVTDDAVWALYSELVLGGYAPPTRAVDVWSFGNDPEMASRLVHLVSCGAKRATMGWVDASEVDGTPIAYEGGFSIVTDGYGYPRVALRSTKVTVQRFDAVTAADAAAEGEGDLTYADWHEGHVAYFTKQAKQVGIPFRDASRIAVEHFDVVHRF